MAFLNINHRQCRVEGRGQELQADGRSSLRARIRVSAGGNSAGATEIVIGERSLWARSLHLHTVGRADLAL